MLGTDWVVDAAFSVIREIFRLKVMDLKPDMRKRNGFFDRYETNLDQEKHVEQTFHPHEYLIDSKVDLIWRG